VSDMTREPVVRLRDGMVRGTVSSGVLAFLGIPYAAAPFGADRMRPPQPAQPWSGSVGAAGRALWEGGRPLTGDGCVPRWMRAAQWGLWATGPVRRGRGNTHPN
jgi:hypothetical protein